MAAPRVKIFFENGALGIASENADGVFGMLCTGVSVGSTFVLGRSYILRGMASLKLLGVTSTNNPDLYRAVKLFYDEAGNGVELWVMAFPDTVKLGEMVDVTDPAKGMALLKAANGRLRGLIVSRTPDVAYTPTVTAGVDADVTVAASKAQALAEWATDTLFAPIFVLLDGYAYNGNAVSLTDLTTGSYDRVAIALSTEVSGNKNTIVPLVAGRLAKSPVQKNLAAVLDGPINTLTAFIGTKPVEQADWESIHNKGYLVLRTYPMRTGYFLVDDPMATLATSDYSHLTARRTIDKAYRIAYNTIMEKLLGGIAVNADGTIQTPMAKSWQADVERAIAANMTAFGELSANITDPNDKGVTCYINPAQNVLSSSRVEVQLRVRPFAYARYIDVYLGFQVAG